MKSAQYWINQLQLQAHPEGGYFGEVYRSEEQIQPASLPERYRSARSMGTSIYFLVTKAGFSAFHRLETDELWHFYTGAALRIHVLTTSGGYQSIWLGADYEARQRFQVVVPSGTWFAAEVESDDAYALVGCTMAPGFDFEDFTLADRDQLLEQFPEKEHLIQRLTRQ